jgi:hypothetical protein
MWKSPHLPAPTGEMRPRRVSAAGQKKGIFEQDRAKAGQQGHIEQVIPLHGSLRDCR